MAEDEQKMTFEEYMEEARKVLEAIDTGLLVRRVSESMREAGFASGGPVGEPKPTPVTPTPGPAWQVAVLRRLKALEEADQTDLAAFKRVGRRITSLREKVDKDARRNARVWERVDSRLAALVRRMSIAERACRTLSSQVRDLDKAQIRCDEVVREHHHAIDNQDTRITALEKRFEGAVAAAGTWFIPKTLITEAGQDQDMVDVGLSQPEFGVSAGQRPAKRPSNHASGTAIDVNATQLLRNEAVTRLAQGLDLPREVIDTGWDGVHVIGVTDGEESQATKDVRCSCGAEWLSVYSGTHNEVAFNHLQQEARAHGGPLAVLIEP